MKRLSPKKLGEIGIECIPSECSGYLGHRFENREQDPSICGSLYGMDGQVSVFKFHKQWMMFILLDDHEEYHLVDYIEDVQKWLPSEFFSLTISEMREK